MYIDKLIYYMENYKEIGDCIPMKCGACLYIGIADKTYDNERAINSDFDKLARKLKQMQERQLVNDSYKGVVNKGVGLRLLAVNHNYIEKQVVETSDAKAVNLNMDDYYNDRQDKESSSQC